MDTKHRGPSPIAQLMICLGLFGASLAWLARVDKGLPNGPYFWALIACATTLGASIGAVFGRPIRGAIIGLVLLGGFVVFAFMSFSWQD